MAHPMLVQYEADLLLLGRRVAVVLEDEAQGWGPMWDAIVEQDMRDNPERWAPQEQEECEPW